MRLLKVSQNYNKIEKTFCYGMCFLIKHKRKDGKKEGWRGEKKGERKERKERKGREGGKEKIVEKTFTL